MEKLLTTIIKYFLPGGKTPEDKYAEQVIDYSFLAVNIGTALLLLNAGHRILKYSENRTQQNYLTLIFIALTLLRKGEYRSD